jgi:hypothetical protein
MSALAHQLARCLPDEAQEPLQLVLPKARRDNETGDLGGTMRSTPYGPCRVLTHRYPLTHRHGDRALGDFAHQALAHRGPGVLRA